MFLPPGLESRALRREDAESVLEVMAAAELSELGRVDIELADIESDWARPSLDLEAGTRGAFAGDRLVGFAQTFTLDHWVVDVHPEFAGQGIGTALADWSETAAASMGADKIGQWVIANGMSDRFLAHRGYLISAQNRSMAMPEGVRMVEPELPEGFRVREAKPIEHRAIYQLIEASMLEWADRERYTFEDYMAVFVNRPGSAPWLNRVAIGPSGAVVGAVTLLVGHEDPNQAVACAIRLCVAPEFRGLGIAPALLASAFRQARRRNITGAKISVDSRSHAWTLVDQWGFETVDHWALRVKTL